MNVHDVPDHARRYLAISLATFLIMSGGSASAQTFNAGSDGSDGVYAPSGPPGTIVLFDPTQFHGSQAASNIFNFSQIIIPAGVTVKFSGVVSNGPVYWLSQNDVTIAGTLDLSGGKGHDGIPDTFARVPSIPGPGGYPGGVGGNAGTQRPMNGAGPGGGTPSGFSTIPFCCLVPSGGSGGSFSGNQFLIPVVGGSGGGGGGCNCDGAGPGGGAGGGALLIASSGAITITGSIRADGGNTGANNSPPLNQSGNAHGGSGGAIRLVANTITGAGALSASGGSPGGGAGQIRLEATSRSFAGTLAGSVAQSTPFPLLLPTAGPPVVQVISINGIAINANPSTFPDITINSVAAVPVVIQTHNIPATGTIKLTILDQNGVADTVITPPPVGNCDQNNFCTTTVNVVFPFGASRGLTKVTWTP